jgi:DNA-binding winged helix-turn-helix (wHTH) protein
MHKHYIINGVVEFHPATSTLRDLNNPDRVVVLNSPAGRCLLLLIEKSGTIVTQQEFLDIVWEKRGMLVSPNTYYQNISILRKGLKGIGFTEDPVVTIPRIGLTLAAGTLVQIKDEPEWPESSFETSAPLPTGRVDECAIDNSTASPEIAPEMPEQPSFIGKGHKPQITENQPKNRVALLASTVGSIVLFAGLLFGFNVNKESRYFSDYRLEVHTQGCRIFLARNIQTPEQRSKALSFSEEFKGSCASYPWIYVSYYTMLPRASVIRCNRPMQEANRCITDYFFEDL